MIDRVSPGQLHTIGRVKGGGAVERERPTHLGDISEKDNISKGNDGLLIEHVKLLGDGCRQEATAKDGRASLGDQTRV